MRVYNDPSSTILVTKNMPVQARRLVLIRQRKWPISRVMASKCRHAVGTTNQLAPHQDGPSLKLMRPSLKSRKTVLKEKFTLHSGGNMISVSTQAKA